MASPPFAVSFDLSCAFDEPRTGVGYAAVDLVRALSALDNAPELKLFATRSGRSATHVPELDNIFSRQRILPRAGRIKHALWLNNNVPPIEWFTGNCAIAHGLFHLLPAARKAKRVVTIHDLSFMRHPEHHTHETVVAHTAMVQHAVRHADAIITVSNTVRAELLETFANLSADRVHAVPNGVDIETFATRADASTAEETLKGLDIERGRYFIYVGTLEPRKNVERMIDAFRMAIRETKEPFKLILVGKIGWHSEGIVRAIDRIQDEGVGLHAGRLPRSQTVALLQNARACLYPSIYEGFGMPLIEAMAAGAPVIAGDIPVLREVGGEDALYAKVDDALDLSQQIARFMCVDNARQDYAKRGPLRAKQFTWQHSAERLLETYKAIL